MLLCYAVYVPKFLLLSGLFDLFSLTDDGCHETSVEFQQFYDTAKKELHALGIKSSLNANFNCVPTINRAKEISPYFTTSGSFAICNGKSR